MTRVASPPLKWSRFHSDDNAVPHPGVKTKQKNKNKQNKGEFPGARTRGPLRAL